MFCKVNFFSHIAQTFKKGLTKVKKYDIIYTYHKERQVMLMYENTAVMFRNKKLGVWKTYPRNVNQYHLYVQDSNLYFHTEHFDSNKNNLLDGNYDIIRIFQHNKPIGSEINIAEYTIIWERG